MFAKRLIQKATQLHQQNHHTKSQHNSSFVISADLDFQVAIHYGIPLTASIIAFDAIQRLLAIGTLDGRIKVIGGDNIEGLLISQEQLPYKYLEFLLNQGYLVSISNDNNIQVWNLENRCIACHLQWECNITAFSVIYGSNFMYVGDENGLMSVLKYEAEAGEILLLPYHISTSSLAEAAGFTFPDHQTVVGVLPQPCSSGNRVLIAYDIGLIILWDVVEACVIMVRGDKVLDLNDRNVDSPNEVNSLADDEVQHMEQKEISALCWASSDGSILAVGYIDGDILFWKTSTSTSSKGNHAGLSSNNVVKLQLSSVEKRLPVIVLHWCSNSKSKNDVDGLLFIYGGDEIGSDEVLTVLSLAWSPGLETLQCVGRADLQLSGSFADMILSPSAGAISSTQNAALFVLTSPGRLSLFDHDSFSALASQHVEKISISSVKYPMLVPTDDPVMTTSKLISLPTGENSSKTLFEITTRLKSGSTPKLVEGTKWPMTGGIATQLSSAEDNRIERLCVAGYEDGSVRIWDATYPVLNLLCVLEGGVKGIEVAGSNASVSKLEFCIPTLCLAVGNKSGLICLYTINGSLSATSFHLVTDMKSEAHKVTQGKGFNCIAMFVLINSPVQALEFSSNGAKLAVGYESGCVAVLDTSSLSVSFLMDSLSEPSFPVVSITWKDITPTADHNKSPKQLESKVSENAMEESIIVLTKDAKIYVIHGGEGSVIISKPMHLKEVISMYVIDGNFTSELRNRKQPEHSSGSTESGNEPAQDAKSSEIDHFETKNHKGRSSKDPLILLCGKDALYLYHTKSVFQGDNKPVSKVKLGKSCCWAATIKKCENICAVVLLYQTGEMEVRSLPELELVEETSLISMLRWNFKANMERIISSTEGGQIFLVNGSEVAFISLFNSENNFRIPEYLPTLHDKVLAAAAEAAISISLDHKKKKGAAPGILGGIVKGFKAGKVNNTVDDVNSNSNFSQLEPIFRRNPFPDSVATTIDDQKVGFELDIDDIHIDEPVSSPSTLSHKEQKKKGTEREQLLDGEVSDAQPRLRTREEIIATYRKEGDASSVAGQARDKLVERQEKLERISRQTEELRNGAEDFASLANELVKVMERRKWWHI